MNNAETLLADLQSAVREQCAPSARLRLALAGTDDPVVLRKAGRILAKLRSTDGELAPVRVAVLATCTVGAFAPLLRATLVGAGLLPTIEPAPYATFELSLAGAAFAADGDPDLVACLLTDSYLLPGDWDPTDVAALTGQLAERLAALRDLVLSAVQRTTATLVLHTVPMPAEVRDGLLSWRARAAVAAAWHQLNAGLLALAAEHPQIVVVDLVGVLADAPVAVRDDRLHRYADLPYTDGALALLADQVRRVAQARSGRSRKVLALDLDNTLWGGVLGEVGAAGVQLGGLYPGNCYTALQRTVARLRDQGVVLVLASKNDADAVDEALTGHPEMLLRPAAFSARAVNWSAKPANLRQAADTLGLSTQSFVFMDDSEFERGHVGAELPEIAVVSAAGDPAQLTRSLLRGGWFDVLSLTDTDRDRPELYRSRALRTEYSTGFSTAQDYLHALRIELTAAPVTAFTVPRVAQLAARTNQFNLTGIRFDEATTAALADSPEHLVASFAVRDNFGDEGIVGAVWIDRDGPTWRLRNVVLSCRVLGRGIEFAMVEWIAGQARQHGAERLEGRFVPSTKNGVADGFLEKAGFIPVGTDGVLHLNLADRPEQAPAWIRLRADSDS